MYLIRRRGTCLPQAAVLLMFMAVAVLGSAPAARAQDDSSQGSLGLISLDVVDADLSKVVLLLARESKQSIIIADQDKMHSKVTATLKQMPLETALKYVVESVGCSWSRSPDGVYIIGGSAQAQPALVGQGAEFAPTVPLTEDMSGYNRPYEARRDTKVDVIKLYNMRAVDMMWTLGIYNMEDAPKVENAEYKPGVSYIQRGDGQVEPLFFPAQSTPPLTQSLKSNPASALRAPEVSEEAGQGYPPGPPTAYPRNPIAPTTPRPTNVPGGTGTSPTGKGLLPEGIEYIIPYEVDNSLIVRGDQEGIEELKAIVSKLDIAPKQIMIKAEFVNISVGDVAKLGIDWNLERLNSTFSAQMGSAGNVRYAYANGNLMATLQTMLTETKAKVINAPLISTLNNVMATITVTQQIPNWVAQNLFTSNGVASTVYIPQPLVVTSYLQVLPRINNADNSITVTISPQLSFTGKEHASPDGKTSLPDVTSQVLTTTRRVANGETIILGGMIQKSTTDDVTKIPLLADLPFIGPLFRSTSTSTTDNETLIFLTPTIVPERPIAGSGIGVIP